MDGGGVNRRRIDAGSWEVMVVVVPLAILVS
jgi:hypothetical protein